MASKKLGISTIDLNIKFKDKKESKDYARSLIEHIRYICDKKANDGWSTQAMICISNTRGGTCYQYHERNGKPGRPKRVKRFSEFDLKYYNGNMNVDWHMHILIVSKPSYAFMNEIKKYIDKNWKGAGINNQNIDNIVYIKSANINIAEYFIDQCDEILLCNCNKTNEDIIPKGYSLKDLYNSYMNKLTANVYCRKYIISNNWEEKEKIDSIYYNIKNFYYSITEEQDSRREKAYMKQEQMDRIKANSKHINNKVQNVSRVKDEECYSL